MPGSPAKAPNVMELLRVASGYLRERGIESARLDAEVLLAHVLRTDRTGLYVHHDRLLDKGEVDAYRRLIADRARRRPVAQLTGEREFFGLKFRVTPDVLIPRPETELLVEGALERVDERRPARVLDVGTGSGAIAVSIAVHRPSARVWAVDVSEHALNVAKQNAAAHGVSGRVRFVAGDWLNPVAAESERVQFDVVVSNPPYIPTARLRSLPVDVRDFEPRLALDGGPDGLDPHRLLLRRAGRLIRPGGWLGLEIGDGQERAFVRLAEQAAADYERPAFQRDLQGIPRVGWLRRAGSERSDRGADVSAAGGSAHPAGPDAAAEWREAPWYGAYRRALPMADRVVKGTVVLEIDPDRPDPKKVRAAAGVLARGGLVAFPTETVYGLGADAERAAAVRSVYEAKGRPQDNPLIVHASSVEQARGLCVGCDAPLSALVERLAGAFWPGPLTVVLPHAGVVSGEVTGGRDTVAVRVPAHPAARALIAASSRLVAAPSANRSGRPSPSSADHVLDDLAGRIPIVVDSGSTDVGIESTVLDLTVSPPAVLRPGLITAEELEAVCGGAVAGAAGPPSSAALPKEGAEAQFAPRAPGMKYRHYAPRTPMRVLEGAAAAVAARAAEEWASAERAGERLGLLLTDETAAALEGLRPTGGDFPPAGTASIVVLGSRTRPEEVASRLFAALRAMDAAGVDYILAEGVEERGVGVAVMNRMRKAAGGRLERL